MCLSCAGSFGKSEIHPKSRCKLGRSLSLIDRKHSAESRCNHKHRKQNPTVVAESAVRYAYGNNNYNKIRQNARRRAEKQTDTSTNTGKIFCDISALNAINDDSAMRAKNTAAPTAEPVSDFITIVFALASAGADFLLRLCLGIKIPPQNIL